MSSEIDIRFYVGKGGTGKSTLLQQHLKGENRLLILDANAEPAYQELCDTVTTSLAEAARAADRGKFKIALRVPFGGDAAAIFEAANEIAWCAGNLHLVWEEVHNYRTGSDLPRKGISIINQGRHRGVKLSAATRRPTYLRTLTASVTSAYVFRSSEPADLKFYGDLIGQEAAAAAAELAEYHYIKWTTAGWHSCKPARVRK